jgi:inorganic triphosphatase YgiF
MKTDPHTPEPQEIELKLSLPGANPAELAKTISSLALLVACESKTRRLHNTYYDTPDQQLRRQRVALRLRRTDGLTMPQWQQTLKTSAAEPLALSRRGEWEATVPGPALSMQALESTPWNDIDPTGCLFEALVPCFVTDFERMTWLLRSSDDSVVEVALDIGHIAADGRLSQICELELELKSGRIAALFVLARLVANTLAVLPFTQSKAERGFLLAQGVTNSAQRAVPPKLGQGLTRSELAQRVLQEMFGQFTANLNAISQSDDPELVHQARIGWRRFKSALRLLKKLPEMANSPDLSDLQTLISSLGELRNLEVALLETLPQLSSAYCQGDKKREASWLVMLELLTAAIAAQRQSVRNNLNAPKVGVTLLLITEWLENLNASDGRKPSKDTSTHRWAVRRILRLRQSLTLSLQKSGSPEQEHQVRILAKRLRYGIQALRELLPRRLADLASTQAENLQTAIGLRRDLQQASDLVAALEVDAGIADYLRGVAVGVGLASPTIHAAPK